MKDVERRSAALDPYLEDFEGVLRVIELSSNFVLLPIVVPGPDLAHHIANWLATKNHPAVIWAPDDDSEWKNIAEWLLKAKPEKNGIIVVIGGSDVPDDLSLALRLVNERRDTIAKHLDCPLLWCGSSEFLVQTGQHAPDFWSVRAVERRMAARKGSESKKVSRKEEFAKDDLLQEALRQGDRKSSEILFLSHLRKAMADPDNGEFDTIVASVPAKIEQSDPKFGFEAGLMKAEMARRRGNIADALEMLDALDEKIGAHDDECRVDLLRGRVFEKAGDTKRAQKAYERAQSVLGLENHNWEILSRVYYCAFVARTSQADWTSNLRITERMAKEGKDRQLHALATTFLAEANARQHDHRRAQRILREAIALHEESTDDRTILFGGEVADAIQQAKEVIERAQESAPITTKFESVTDRPRPAEPEVGEPVSRPRRSYFPVITLVLVTVAMLVLGIYVESRAIRRDTMHCFQNPAGQITCGESLEHCEKLRTVAGSATSGPCQKPLFAPANK